MQMRLVIADKQTDIR